MSFAQCGEFLRSNLTKAELEPCASNSAAAQNLKDLKQKNIAAIAPEFCASIYDLKILRAGINDLNNNQTRFWLLSKDSSLKLASRPEKSSLVFQIIDEPGSLFNILKAFTKHQVNITRIESRPAKDSLGSYLFCIDFAASREDERFSNIMKEVSMYFNYYRWLGSYSSTN
jgi:prephenate dehydratase